MDDINGNILPVCLPHLFFKQLSFFPCRSFQFFILSDLPDLPDLPDLTALCSEQILSQFLPVHVQGTDSLSLGSMGLSQ